LLLCRIAGGTLSGALVQFVSVAALLTMPRKSMMSFTVCMTAARNTGLCFGLFLCSALLVSVEKLALPLLAMSICWALVAAVFTLFVPPELAPLRESAVAEDDRDARLAQVADPSELRLGQSWLPDLTARTWTVVLCVGFSVFCSTSLGLLEVSSNLILQSSYGWSAPRVCYVLGFISVISTVWLLLSTFVLRQCQIEDSAYLVWLGGLSVLAVPFLFHSSMGTFRAMAVATLLIDACVFTMSGIADGMAHKSTIEGTHYSLASFNMARASGASLARALAGPLAQGMLKFGSRNAFAGCLAMLLLVGLLLVKRVWVLWDPKGHNCPEMTPPPAQHREETDTSADPRKAFVLLEEVLYPELTGPSSSQGAAAREDSESRWSDGTPTFGTDDDRSISPYRSMSAASRPGRSRNLRELCPPRRESSSQIRNIRDSLLSTGRRSLPASLPGGAASSLAPPGLGSKRQKAGGKVGYSRSREGQAVAQRGDAAPAPAEDQTVEGTAPGSAAKSVPRRPLPESAGEPGPSSSGADAESGAAASSEAESSFVDAESSGKRSSAGSGADAEPESARGRAQR